MPIEHTRRGLLRGAGALLICAPAIVRAASLDAIRGVPMGLTEAWCMEEMQRIMREAVEHTVKQIEYNLYHRQPPYMGSLLAL